VRGLTTVNGIKPYNGKSMSGGGRGNQLGGSRPGHLGDVSLPPGQDLCGVQGKTGPKRKAAVETDQLDMKNRGGPSMHALPRKNCNLKKTARLYNTNESQSEGKNRTYNGNKGDY